MRPRKTVRLPNFDYTGQHRYLFTICTCERRPVFANGDVVSETLSQFVQAAEDEQHEFIRRAKQLSGYHYATTHGDRLWQRYSWDRVLRSDDDTLSAVRYVLENPVRAGLVKRARDYPYSGSMTWSMDELAEVLWAG